MVEDKKLVTIVVEATPHEWPKDEISYDEVVAFEFPDHEQHPERNYAVTYKRGHGNKPQGVLLPGTSVRVKDQMIFNVADTGQS
jgi:multiubiquitin